MRTVVPERALNLLRSITDLEPPKEASKGDSKRDALGKAGLRRSEHAFGPAPSQCPIELEPEKLSEAQRLFAAYRTEIAGALLLAALPQSYAAEFGAGVLAANGEMQHDLSRRIRRTSLFLLTVMQQAFDDEDQHRLWDCTHGGAEVDDSSDLRWSVRWPLRMLRSTTRMDRVPRADPLPWEMCVRLRTYHEMVRRSLNRRRHEEPDGPIAQLLGTQNDAPLNQEDMLGMMLTFSITVFEVLERYGIAWTADQQESYLHAWDVIGAYLGIGTPMVVKRLEADYANARGSDEKLPPPPLVTNRWHGLRPPSVDDARVLLDQIRRRQWTDPCPDGPFELRTWTSLRAGRILTRALLDELDAAMPGFLALEPITVMRALAPAVVRDRLNLGNGGLVMGALARLPARRIRTDRFTALNAPNVLAAAVLHRMANDVTTRASARFIEDADYVLPEFGDWSTEGSWRG